MVKVFDWDKEKFRPIISDWQPVPVSRSAGPGLGNRTQIRIVDNAVWRGTFAMRTLHGDALREFRALISSLRGMGGAVNVPIYDQFTPSAGLSFSDWYLALGINSAQVKCAGGLSFADGTCFNDGTGFYIPTEADISGITSVTSAVIGDTKLTLSFIEGIRIGVRFSVSNFLHEVISIGADKITFEPPLRKAVSIGDSINFTDPRIRVRLSSDGGGAVPVNRIGMISSGVTVNFTEVFER